MQLDGAQLTVLGNDWGKLESLVSASLRPARQRSILPRALSEALAAVVNPMVASWLRQTQQLLCPAPELPPPPIRSADVVDWNQSQVFDSMDRTINQIVTPSHLNALVNLLTNGTGEVVLHGSELHSRNPLVGISVSSMSLSGLNSAREVGLLKPVNGQKTALRSSFAMQQLRLSVALSARLAVFASPLALNVEASMGQVEMEAVTQLALNSSSLGQLQLAQMLNHTGCLSRPLLEASIQKVDAIAASFSLSASGYEWGASDRPVTARSRSMDLSLPGVRLAPIYWNRSAH